eukprot:COSAG06_NODE_24367_length_665_cov_0.683746_1_plen_149_part_01
MQHAACSSQHLPAGIPVSPDLTLTLDTYALHAAACQARDPRWGRTDETPSEDPYVLGQHALHSVLGAQNGPDPTLPMIGVTLKHWIGNNVEGGVGKYTRQNIDANISGKKNASLLRHFKPKLIILPRQAPDKHNMEDSKKMRFLAAYDL